MTTATSNFKDAAAERTLISTIVKHGKDALVDAQAFVASNDFSLPINRALFTCLSSLAEDTNCNEFDIDTIQLKAKTLGLSNVLTGKKEQEYLDLLNEGGSSVNNIPVFGIQIKKYSVIRDLYQRYENAQNYLSTVKGDESLSEIIRNAESSILDYVNGNEDESILSSLCDDLVENVLYKIDNEEVDQIGVPTGFNKYDKMIGGGLRLGTINVIAARPKTAKSFMALNMARNIAKQGIKVLYLDTEMTKVAQQSRLISIESGCPIEKYETGKFRRDKDLTNRVLEASHYLQNIPFQYQSISGMSHTEALNLARRWLVKDVGIDDKGHANPCAIVYDYLKLTNSDQLTKNLAEWNAIGFMMSDIHSFAVKYKVPILSFVQLNRSGIDNTDGAIVSQSDRILWLCSSMSILRNKDNNDEDLQCGFQYGNKKLSLLESRYGAGLPFEDDYINLKANLRPRVTEEVATGLIEEGSLYSEVKGQC